MNNITLSAILSEKNTSKIPPQYILDRIADQKITGGYKISKSNICKICFTTRYANGSCNCNY